MFCAGVLTLRVIKHWPLAITVLTVLTFVLPNRFKARTQAIWMLALLLCGVKGFGYQFLGGDALAPDLPEIVIWLWNWATDGMFMLLALSLVWWVRKWRAWLLPVLAWSIAAVGQYNGTIPPTVREVELEFANLPAGLDGYRIVHMSDVHCSGAARKWRTQAVVDIANSLSADVICLTGDYVDGKREILESDMAPLKELRARDGVYWVRGNHEYYMDMELWRHWFEENGMRPLVNECVIPRPGLAIGGVNDYYSAEWHGDTRADVGQAFAAATNSEFRVLLEHRPNHAMVNADKYGVDLQLSGHTHGGIAPIIKLVVSKWNRGYYRGVYRDGNMTLHVSPGCGQWAGFPMRFFDPSEITVIKLRCARNAQQMS